MGRSLRCGAAAVAAMGLALLAWAGCTAPPDSKDGQATTAASRTLAGVPLTACTIKGEHPTPAQTSALCGSLTVPEDPARPTGRHLDLRVAVIPATGAHPAPDPVFLVAGGPGEASTQFFAWFPSLHAELHAARDIVLVDQRGTGASNAVTLPQLPVTTGLSRAAAEARLSAWARRGPRLDRRRPAALHLYGRGRRPRRRAGGAGLPDDRPLRHVVRRHPRAVLPAPAPRARAGRRARRSNPARRPGLRADGGQQPGSARPAAAALRPGHRVPWRLSQHRGRVAAAAGPVQDPGARRRQGVRRRGRPRPGSPRRSHPHLPADRGRGSADPARHPPGARWQVSRGGGPDRSDAFERPDLGHGGRDPLLRGVGQG